ncbi:response regulator transcription factor [Paenibacillus crassostreae]|uniref:Two-component system response regulator n=1 Tax=Paenibacillus crassostreae TaxID=1763538 RepID=A0A167AK23_9BACL|nr:response regulator transcription factor [Paenibacillus crassostreae]AOZ92404.1 hypothetical protein LPB68_09275 [Paenibacillus crassostreae]OAB71119.1 hypothetical protein PNBC_21425 [Paenibacillus crassostreae]
MSELCKVLIVDDEYLVRQGIKHLLHWEEEGFHMVGEAGNGKEALEMVATLEPHIVITDMVMPVMDGEEFVRRLKTSNPNIEIIVLSSFSEFEYVKSTFQSGVADYILKPTLETEGLLHVLRATADKIPSLRGREHSLESFTPSVDHIIDKLISGYETDTDVTNIRDSFPYDGFCLLGCPLKSLQGKKQNEIDSYKSNLLTELKDYLSPNEVRLHLIQTEPHLFIVLLNCRHTEVKQMTDILRHMLTSMREQKQGVWVLGELFQHLDQLGSIYRESFMKQMEYSFYFPEQLIIVTSELPMFPKLNTKFNLNQFTDEIKRKQSDTAFQYLQEHVEVLAAQFKNDVFEFKSFLSNIIFVIITLLDGSEVDTEELNEEKYVYFKRMEEAEYARDAVIILQTFLDKVKLMIGSVDNKDNKRVQQLLDYMHEHYAEPLTLAELSNHFHFNASYLSSYFSAHTKEGFSEYLNRIRIEKAIEMLKDDDYTISVISGSVGYSDHSYFCKVFKKFTGDSPSSYRRKFMKQEK